MDGGTGPDTDSNNSKVCLDLEVQRWVLLCIMPFLVLVIMLWFQKVCPHSENCILFCLRYVLCPISPCSYRMLFKLASPRLDPAELTPLRVPLKMLRWSCRCTNRNSPPSRYALLLLPLLNVWDVVVCICRICTQNPFLPKRLVNR